MKPLLTLCFSLFLTTLCSAQQPEMPTPSKEHEFLAQFAGDWDVTASTVPAPGEQPIVGKGTESAKMLGGFWLVSEAESDMMGMAVSSRMTFGYDPKRSKYVGTFFCSMDSHLWTYEGTMDETGKKLTLNTRGHSPTDFNTQVNYREVLELVDKDHKTFTSYMEGENGQWVKFMTMDYRRRK